MHDTSTTALLTSSFVATANGFEVLNFFLKAKGVSPNIPVGLSPEELLAGEDPQMQKALELVREL